MPVHLERQAQIEAEAQVGALIFDETPTTVSAKYSNYSKNFSAENAAEIPKNTGINKHTIKLEEDKQPLFRSIYSLGLVELETLKTYIKINLANGFIRFFKSLTRAPILFDKKSNKSLQLCIDY